MAIASLAPPASRTVAAGVTAASRQSLAWVCRQRRPRLVIADGSTPIRIADVFAGCGGLSLGVQEAARQHRLRIDIRLAVDLDRDAAAVYRANFPAYATAVRQADVAELFDGPIASPYSPCERNVKDQCGTLDFLIAGPPCQGHSDLNNSTRREDPRNLLYLRAVRAIEVLQPRHAFIENVPSVVHDRANVVLTSERALRAGGYHVTSAVIDMRSLGLPQRRRRHVLFATKAGAMSIRDIAPATNVPAIALGPFLEGLEDEPRISAAAMAQPARMTVENRRRVAHLFDHDVYDLPNGARPPCHRDRQHSYNSVYGRLRWDRPAQTITSGFGSMGQGRYIHPRRPRLITPHEAARIQGIPDFFDFSAATGQTSLRRMIGNAVPPPLMIALAGAVLEKDYSGDRDTAAAR